MIKKILFTLFLFVFIIDNQAQTIAGGELYYKLIGTSKYKLTAKIYRRCNGNAINNLVNAEVLGGAYNVSINYTRTNIKKLHDTCGNPCNNQNQVSNFGYEQHTYEAEIDFTKAPYNIFPNNNVCDVIFTISAGARDYQSTAHASGYSFIEAGTNICNSFISVNSSPQFLVLPTFEFSCNNTSYFNNIGLDTANYDSLAYSLVQLKHDYSTTIAYKNNHTKDIPVTPYCPPNPGVLNCNALPNSKPSKGFFFNTNNGDIAFTPTDCAEKSTIVIRIDEFRKNPSTGKMVRLGFVIRDFSVSIFQVTNNNNVRISTNNFNPLFCNGVEKCISFQTSDILYSPTQKTSDTVRVSWLNLINGTTISLKDSKAREPEIVFCLKRDTLTLEPKAKYFAITTYDRNCNINTQSRLFEVQIGKSRSFGKKYRLSKCGSVVYTILPYDNDTKTSFSTSISKLNGSIIEDNGNGISDSLTVHENGKYSITYTSQNSTYSCPYIVIDTIEITNAFYRPILNIPKDSIVCKNDSVDVFYLQSLSPTAKYFTWYLNGVALLNSDTFLKKIGIAQSTDLKLEITNNIGCKASKQINFNLKHYNAIHTNYNACYNNNFTLSTIKGYLPKPYIYTWYINGVKNSSKDSFITFFADNNKTVSIDITDAKGCIISDITSVNLYNNYQLNLTPKNVCIDSLTNIIATGSNILSRPQYNWILNNVNYSGNNFDFFQIKPKTDTKLKLVITDRYGCIYQDSVILNIVNPKFELPKDTAICMQQILPLRPSIISPNTSPIYYWSSNNTIFSNDSFLNYNIIKNETIYLKIEYNTQCFSQDSIKIYAQQNPVFTMPANFNICKNNIATISPTYTNSNSLITYHWFNKNALMNQKAIANIRINETGYILLKVSNTSKCTTIDSMYINALPLPQPIITGKTQYSINENIVLSLTKDYKNYQWSVGTGTKTMQLKANLLGVPGYYNITCNVTDSNGCQAIDTITIYTGEYNSVYQINNYNFKIMPNPFTQNLHLISSQNGLIKMINSEGKIVFTQTIIEGENLLLLDNLNIGLYILKLENERGSWQQKIIKE